MRLKGTFEVIDKTNVTSTLSFIQDINIGDVLELSMPVVSHSGYGRKHAVWVDVKHVSTGSIKQFSINELVGKFQRYFKLKQLT